MPERETPEEVLEAAGVGEPEQRDARLDYARQKALNGETYMTEPIDVPESLANRGFAGKVWAEVMGKDGKFLVTVETSSWDESKDSEDGPEHALPKIKEFDDLDAARRYADNLMLDIDYWVTAEKG